MAVPAARVFYAVKNNQKFRAGHHVGQVGIFAGGAIRKDALMRLPAGSALQIRAIFKADWNLALAAKINDFLNARSSRAFCDQNFVDASAGDQRFADRMDSNKNAHDLDSTLIESLRF